MLPLVLVGPTVKFHCSHTTKYILNLQFFFFFFFKIETLANTAWLKITKYTIYHAFHQYQDKVDIIAHYDCTVRHIVHEIVDCMSKL